MKAVIGIDEVGRGAWAGPLVVCAVYLSVKIEGLRDSKQLSAKSREALDLRIRQRADFIGLGWVTAVEVDNLGLTNSMKLGCKRALADAPRDIEIIIDGNINYLTDNPLSSCLINGDSKVTAISAASIVAKVARDTYMVNCEQDYKGYGFDRHVGYGTKQHRDAISLHGVTAIHRKRFKPVKALLVQK